MKKKVLQLINSKYLMERCVDAHYLCKITIKGFLNKVKPYGFTLFIKRYGIEERLDCLERNEKNRVVYHR
ncbi:hypothetical protein CLRAG_23860 [Clostridium ragsdalei P11]|uniref:Uncharacterized protein n=1 Tax=Clostridium ragsdalei P11 TaxID=1353534 RepID=A0A1A6ARM4_9CLOT|nr:hypothetical protein CLRAG_23860 [Clostridium ragsdalei P11]